VWEQLKVRCTSGHFQLQEAPDLRSASTLDGNVGIGVASWSEVLEVLQLALAPLTSPKGYWELQQLRGLCEYEDQQVFEPLDVSDLQRQIGRRIGEYRDLAFEVVESAHDGDLVDTRNLKRTALGRYFKLKGWECWLGLDPGLWATQEHQSPLWLFITDRRAENSSGVEEAFRKVQAKGLISNDGKRRICLRLPVGKNRDEVLENLTQQIAMLAALLPPKLSATSTNTGSGSEIV
jgi:hypothetical protein